MTYEYLSHDSKKLQVESAIRDSNGYIITDTYVKKIQEVLVTCTGTTKKITVTHYLGLMPSSVEMFICYDEVSGYDGVSGWKKFDADVSATEDTVVLDLSVAPPADTQILIKITI